jgi:hypothetical protein
MKPSSRPRKSANLSDSVQQQLNKYALAAGAAGMGVLAFAHPADAKVVYTPADTNIMPDHTIPLDLNHDGIVDFAFRDVYRRSHPYGFDHTGLLSVAPANPANKIEGFSRINGNYVSALGAGVSIGPNAKFTTGPNQIEEAFIDTGRMREVGFPCDSTWPSGQNRYLGVQFLINGEVHFGWARLNVTCTGLHVVAKLTGYAYETIANTPIIAGQTTGSGEETRSGPEAALTAPASKPAALGLLALGSHGLSMWRREGPVGSIGSPPMST